ncbi:AAA family ATPase [Bacillus sp. BA3]|uniref:AAA family ATPase n=1 Tax=Bacillus sp. BA3 TaxID=2057910 RepID=UPI001E5BEA99|nr:AAA family ATPase [Bacillus sp. BA3]
MKINIIYGPMKEFNSKIPTEDTISLSEMVRWSDARRSNPIEDELIGTYNYLTVSTEEYGGVTDAFIERFIISILIYQNHLGYTEIFLHNPPTRIYDQIQIYKDHFELSIQHSSYPKTSKDALKEIKENFDGKILGQPQAKTEILTALYDLSNNHDTKPKIIMLYGPPGVGKTETALFINQAINQENKLLRKQFSMYHNDSFYSYIFGDRTNSFAKDLIDRESNIILLDEFDKCNKVFFSAFYQLFDEGIYEDKYYKVNLQNAVILCTSNYLSESDIRKNLGEAIFSRFDAFINFHSFSNEVKEQLIDRIYDEEIAKYSSSEIEIISSINIPNLLKQYLSSINNARDIRRYLKQMIATPLIEYI